MKTLPVIALILVGLLLTAKVVGIVVLLWTGAAGRGPFLVKQGVYGAGLGGVLAWLWQALSRRRAGSRRVEPERADSD